jgi:GGDEF domain-containing protein
MAIEMTLEQTQALTRLFPSARKPGDALDALLESEAMRQGAPDPVTGAIHMRCLRDGTLMKEEYELSMHAHTGWVLGAVLLDPQNFTRVNVRQGFAQGAVVLKAIAEGAKAAAPSAKVVRIHGDGFAVLLGPTADLPLSAQLVAQVRESVGAAVARAEPEERELAFTVGQLELTVRSPSHWQVLGPLVWAECERALVVARRAPSDFVQRRLLELDGGLPAFAVGEGR